MLGHYAEARTDFEEILLSNRHYVPALKGLAETCLSQTRECYKDQRLGTARDHAQVALDKLVMYVYEVPLFLFYKSILVIFFITMK